MVVIGVVGRKAAGKKEFIAFVELVFKIKAVYYPFPSNETDQALSNDITKKMLDSWQEDFVIGPLYELKHAKKLKKRPFFHLIYVDAELSLRFANYKKNFPSETLENFVKLDESQAKELYIKELRALARFEIENTGSLQVFHETITKNQKYIVRGLKPSWDQYFMNIAFSVRTRSNCMRKKCFFLFFLRKIIFFGSAGAILVRNNRILSTGYTGTPQGIKNCNEGGCVCCNEDSEDLIQCLCIHAEENCILEVGIAGSEGSTCYCTQFPCIWCLKVLIQGVMNILFLHKFTNKNGKKIKKLFYFREEEDKEDAMAMEILRENHIESERYFKDLNIF